MIKIIDIENVGDLADMDEKERRRHIKLTENVAPEIINNYLHNMLTAMKIAGLPPAVAGIALASAGIELIVNDCYVSGVDKSSTCRMIEILIDKAVGIHIEEAYKDEQSETVPESS